MNRSSVFFFFYVFWVGEEKGRISGNKHLAVLLLVFFRGLCMVLLCKFHQKRTPLLALCLLVDLQPLNRDR